MASTFTNLLYHIVYGTKYRQNLIVPSLREPLYEYIGGIIRAGKGVLIRIGGAGDHVHILAKLSPTIAISEALMLVKANSSKWVNEGDLVQPRFEWQTGYAAFSVSESRVGDVRRYIGAQEEHHRRRTFKEEFVELLRKHNIEFEERYVFEDEHLA